MCWVLRDEEEFSSCRENSILSSENGMDDCTVQANALVWEIMISFLDTIKEAWPI